MNSSRQFSAVLLFIGIIFILFAFASVTYATPNLDKNKTWNEATKTLNITTPGNLWSVRQVSVNPDIVTMEEVFEVTNLNSQLRPITPADFGGRASRASSGRKGINGIEWKYLKNESYTEVVPDFGLVYSNIKIDGVTSYEDITSAWIPGQRIDFGSPDSLWKWNITQSQNFTPGDNKTVGLDDWFPKPFEPTPTNPQNLTAFYTRTGLKSTHTEIRYRHVWADLPLTMRINSGDSILVKVIYHKNAETGDVRIQTVPRFMGIEEENMTWWNTSWSTSFHNNITDGVRPYVLSLNVTNQVGISNGTHLFLNGSCSQVNCTDLRFTTDNTTDAPHWIDWDETHNVSSTLWAKVWINLTKNGTANAYTGSTVATEYNNSAGGAATYWFFDDFKTNSFSKYTKWNVDGWSISGGKLVWNYATENQGNLMVTAAFPDENYSADMDIQMGSAANVQAGIHPDTNPSVPSVALYGVRFVGSTPNEQIFLPGGTANSVTLLYPTLRTKIALSKYGSSWAGYVNDTQFVTRTETWANLNYLGMSAYASAGVSVFFWNFRVRPYISPEPVWVTWGTGQSLSSSYIPPAPALSATTTGNFWVNQSWSAGAGNTTNGYNVSINGTWTNGSAQFFNSTGMSAHGWANISVYAWNSSNTGTLSPTAASENKQVPNNVPTTPQISNPANNTKMGNNSFTGTWNASTDLDTGDSITYHYRVSLLSDFSTVFNESNVSCATTSLITGLSNTTAYYFRVRSNDTRDYSLWSSTVLINENTKPSLVNESIFSTSLKIGSKNTITAYFQLDTDINTAIIKIKDTYGVETNYTMTCTNGTTSKCTDEYTKTSDNDVGTYSIIRYYLMDNFKGQNSNASNLSFTYSTVPTSGVGKPPGESDTSSSSSSSSSSGARPPPAETPPANITGQSLTFINITEGAITPNTEAIARCMTESLIMRNECSNYNYGTVIDPFNWWVIIGGLISAFGVVFSKGVLEKKPRQWFTEPVLYFAVTTILVFVMVYVGFNMYFFNYLFESPKYFWTFFSFGFWGIIISMTGDYYYYTYKKRKKILTLPM